MVNGVDATQYQPRPRSPALEARLGLQSKFVAGYLGTHGLAHALDKVVEAAALLSQRADIIFLFVGGGADRARVEAMVAAIERLAGSPVDRQRLAAAARAAAPCIRGMRLRHRCWAYWSHDAEALAESFPRATATLALRNGSYVSHALWHVRKMRATGDEALLRSD